MATTTNQQAQVAARAILHKRYPDFDKEKNGRRALLANSVFVNDFRVREVGGNNHGPMVGAILEGVGLDEGYAWCGAAQELACDTANVQVGPSDRQSAAVINWRRWGAENHRLMDEPAPGRLCTRLNPDGSTGHMGIVAQVYPDGRTRTYEGNTSAGSSGSQRDGGGWYERIRPAGYWSKYINLD